jgi:hypothetical protein
LKKLEESRDRFYEELENAAINYGSKLVDGPHYRSYLIHHAFNQKMINEFGYCGERYTFTKDYAQIYIVDKGYYIWSLPLPEKHQEYILVHGGYQTSAGFVIPKIIKVYRNPLWYDLWKYRSEDMLKLQPKELNTVGEITEHYRVNYEKWCRRSDNQGMARLMDGIDLNNPKGTKKMLRLWFEMT